MDQRGWPSREEVKEQIAAAWTPKQKTEQIRVEDAVGRVAAEDVYSLYDLPVLRASSMDGISVKSSMFGSGIPQTEDWRPGVEYARADTGDDFPDRYDAVIPIEQVTILENGGIRLAEDVQVKEGMNIRPRGSMLAKGDLLVKKWTKLTPSDLAALVMGGITEIAVVKKPTVAFIPTGSELIPAGETPVRGKTIDSNSILVRHMLLEMGAAPICHPIVPDAPRKLEAAFAHALREADIVLINGGSSKGEEDHNARMLEEKGNVLCQNVAAAPGRPMCVAVIDGKLAINLPGPPIACYYGMDWCIRFAVDQILHQEPPKRPTVEARLTEDIRYGKGMEILCKMELKKTEEGYETRQVPFRASTVVENLTAPGQFITDPEHDLHPAGSILKIELLRDGDQA